MQESTPVAMVVCSWMTKSTYFLHCMVSKIIIDTPLGAEALVGCGLPLTMVFVVCIISYHFLRLTNMVNCFQGISPDIHDFIFEIWDPTTSFTIIFLASRDSYGISIPRFKIFLIGRSLLVLLIKEVSPFGLEMSDRDFDPKRQTNDR